MLLVIVGVVVGLGGLVVRPRAVGVKRDGIEHRADGAPARRDGPVHLPVRLPRLDRAQAARRVQRRRRSGFRRARRSRTCARLERGRRSGRRCCTRSIAVGVAVVVTVACSPRGRVLVHAPPRPLLGDAALGPDRHDGDAAPGLHHPALHPAQRLEPDRQPARARVRLRGLERAVRPVPDVRVPRRPAVRGDRGGAGRRRQLVPVLLRVLLPLSKPALATLAVLTFIWSWSDLLISVVLVQDPSRRLLTPATALLNDQYSTNVPQNTAGVLIAILPMLARVPARAAFARPRHPRRCREVIERPPRAPRIRAFRLCRLELPLGRIVGDNDCRYDSMSVVALCLHADDSEGWGYGDAVPHATFTRPAWYLEPLPSLADLSAAFEARWWPQLEGREAAVVRVESRQHADPLAQAVDLAVWDLRGKALATPVWSLLSAGKPARPVRVYGSLLDYPLRDRRGGCARAPVRGMRAHGAQGQGRRAGPRARRGASHRGA